jgi:hypothetical protein
VDELAARRPHLVGLQEVFQFAVLDQAAGGAVIGGADLLAEIQGRIAARGLPYEVADVQPTTTVGLPLSPTTVLVATDRLVVLRRTDVAPTSTAKGTYAASVPLGPFTVRRGWIRVSTEHDGILYHFVTTHLETQSIAPIQAAQANELIHSVTAGLDGVTLIGGDLNSDAANPGAPSWTPTYGTLLGAGFLDVWTRSHPKKGDAGYTCCQRVDLTNPASLLDQRIDFVLVRDARGPQPAAGLGAYAVEVVGEELIDRTASGRWRADHAGLVAAFRLPRGLGDPH